MTAVRVQYLRRVPVSRVSGEERLIPVFLGDGKGGDRYLPPEQAPAVARQMARQSQLGARVVGNGDQTIGPHYLWLPEEERVIALPPGRAAALPDRLPPQHVPEHPRSPFADSRRLTPGSTGTLPAVASIRGGNR